MAIFPISSCHALSPWEAPSKTEAERLQKMYPSQESDAAGSRWVLKEPHSTTAAPVQEAAPREAS
jgi:hypothetical protein